MPKLVPIEGNPFDSQQTKLIPVDGNPFKDEPDSEKMKWSNVISESVSNLPSSAKEYFGGMINALRHPINTSKAIGHLFAGGVQKMTPGVQEDEKYADAFIDMMKERYGGVEEFKKTLSKDPVGVLADVSALITSGGTALRVAGMGGKISQAGSVVSKVGAGVEPTSILMKAGSLPYKMVPEAALNKMYRSAAKFSTTIPTKERQVMSQLALDKGLMPSRAGIVKANDLIDNLNTQITAKIDDAAASGQRINASKLVSGFDDLIKEYTLSSKPTANKAQISTIKKQIQKELDAAGKTTLTPQEAQKLKQRIYKDLDGWYSKLKNSSASVRAQKLVARNAKEALEQIIPEIKELNKQEGALIELKKALEKSASRISNRDILGIGVPLKGSLGAVVSGPGGAALGVGLGILDTPTVKAKLAIVLNKLKKKGINISPEAAMMRIAAARSGLFEDETSSFREQP